MGIPEFDGAGLSLISNAGQVRTKKPLSLLLIQNGSFSMMKYKRSFLRQDDNTILIIRDNVCLKAGVFLVNTRCCIV